jgi:hypothetical protein
MQLKCPRLPKGISKKELDKGVKVEFEHTDSRRVAECIARAHLAECPDYYRRLEKMEKSCRAR